MSPSLFKYLQDQSEAPSITLDCSVNDASQFTNPEIFINLLILSRLPNAISSCDSAFSVQSRAANLPSSIEISLPTLPLNLTPLESTPCAIGSCPERNTRLPVTITGTYMPADLGA